MLGLLITLLAGLFFLMGSLIAIFIKDNHKLISFSIGMSFVVLIMLVVFDIIPECMSLLPDYTLLTFSGGVLTGFAFLMLLDKLVPHHDHYNNIKEHHHHLSHIGVMTSLALIIHNIVEGMGIYGVASTSLKSGLIYAIAVGLHNIPFGTQITAMLKMQKKRKSLWIYIGLLIFSTLIGGFILMIFANAINDLLLGIILSITVGMIIYILIWELLIELKESFNKYAFFGSLIGVLLMLISMLV